MPAQALRHTAVSDDVRLIGGNVNGRYTLSDKNGIKCFACRAQSFSARSVALTAPVSGAVGESVALHFDEFGFLRGRIARKLEFGFVADLLVDDAERAKIASKIHWIKKNAANRAQEQRAHRRVPLRSPRSSLVLADGRVLDCFLIEASVSGVAVSADITPRLGEPLAVGRAVGRVTRHLEVGFAVQFLKPQDAESLDRILARLH